MKDAFWFKHDASATRDQRIMALLRAHGWEGYGLFWLAVELMREADGYRLDRDRIDDIAFSMRADGLPVVIDFCCQIGIFCCDDGHVWSPRLLRDMEARDAKSAEAATAAHARWGAHADAKRTHSERKATAMPKREEKRREEEKREEPAKGTLPAKTPARSKQERNPEDKEIAQAVISGMESKHGPFANYAKEWTSAYRLVTLARARWPDAPGDFLAAAMESFWERRGAGWLADKPFTPSMLCSLWEHILEGMREQQVDPEVVAVAAVVNWGRR
jgi:hypothetical protein